MKCSSIAMILCFAFAACDKKEAPASAESAKPSTSSETEAAPSATAAAAPAVDIATLPVEEDYEADAEKELTASNLNAKLDELDKEISAP